ncbi:MAG TPA: bifunctional 4-hydroxy-2-oxoglutarate aldolase/2-dehydro-3-deoxy-phosphogluconate aldolase [Ktedonobacteraceae bacterium]|nr:bifunctional 4-hydroxy-2-oxoglutarate aldolase/2-dehydro-3-deoxy-phosphogluconate aldolase [Ktedonobacteraceae bacterium]
MSTTIRAILDRRLIAIVRLSNYNAAREVAQALIAGGISIIEFTLTGTGALAAIASMREVCGESAYIGAGTVLTPHDVEEVAQAGAQFVVTPILNHQVIEACHYFSLPIACGALTPTEIQSAYEAGAELVKVFPASQVGPQYLRDILAPLPHLRLVPTGGVSALNAGDYLKAGAVAVAIGGNLVSERAVASSDWEHITRRAQECVRAVQV